MLTLTTTEGPWVMQGPPKPNEEEEEDTALPPKSVDVDAEKGEEAGAGEEKKLIVEKEARKYVC